MMNLHRHIEKKFPKNWSIEDRANGLYYVRDAELERGTGFLLSIQEESSYYDVQLTFENFAKQLSNYALRQLSNDDNPIRRFFERYQGLSTIQHKNYTEINLDSETMSFENWSLQIVFKKRESVSDAHIFSDILISFILYIFPYKFDAEEESSCLFLRVSSGLSCKRNSISL